MLKKLNGEENTGKRRWTVLFIITLSHILSSFCNLSIPSLTPFLRNDLNLSHAQVGLLMSAFYVGVISVSIPIGWITDRLGVRLALILGLGILGIFMVGFGAASSFPIGCFLLFLAGTGYSSMNPATTKAVMNWFPSQGRATAMGVKQTGIPLGGILAAFTLPPLASSFGWRTSVILVGVISLIFISAVRIGMPPAPALPNERSKMRWGQLREVLSNRSIVALSVMGIFLAGAQLSIITHLVLYLKNEYLFSTVLAGVYLAVAQVGGTAGRIGWGLISDFLARGRRKLILGIIGIIAIIQLFLLNRIDPGISGGLLFLFIGLLGSTTIGYHGVFFGLMGEIVRKEVVGLATGFSLTITFLGIVLFPPIFGHLVDRLGSYSQAWDLLALSWVVAILILILFVKEKKSTQAHEQQTRTQLP
ncbi:MAG: MFS transporter [Thermodesulfobacteriota bacterium]